MDKVLETLKEIGFNTYEAKVYVALLKKYPATGYEVSKLAGIPQSRTYDTLKALTDKQIVAASADRPVTYTPIKPSELTKSYKRRMTANIEYLEKKLPEVKDVPLEPLLALDDTNKTLAKVLELIRIAKKEIYLEIWSQDYKQIEKELLNAYNRNVEIRMVGYDNLQSNFGLVYVHPFTKKLETYFKGRVLILTADNTYTLYAKIPNDSEEKTTGIWTQNEDIAYLVKELIVHDMLLLDVQYNMAEELIYKYGKGFKRLYDKIVSSESIYRK